MTALSPDRCDIVLTVTQLQLLFAPHRGEGQRSWHADTSEHRWIDTQSIREMKHVMEAQQQQNEKKTNER